MNKKKLDIKMTLIRAAETALRRVHVRVKGTWCRAIGRTINADGRVATTWEETPVEMQVLSANASELAMRDTLPRQSEHRVVYMRQPVHGFSPSRGEGGDKLRFFGAEWAVTQELEAWDGDAWCKLLVTRARDIGTPS